ncbi:hypothetical protein IEQ34_003880 [Dendrobium chrysotoxum]|uniref:Profilin n=1 Tax=Dendrobium chrysotoxum TaxID=161865 RepID=A0AAV7HE99_DENCH|nr:hypothetical protein IEQ34_003880 [Dendrobium chrysotoxum]
MSWQTYVDEHLMCDIDGHHLSAAAIVGHDGNVWAKSDSFPQLCSFSIRLFCLDIGIGNKCDTILEMVQLLNRGNDRIRFRVALLLRFSCAFAKGQLKRSKKASKWTEMMNEKKWRNQLTGLKNFMQFGVAFPRLRTETKVEVLLLTFKPQEITAIMNDFNEPGSLAPTGLFLGPNKYMVIQGEAGSVIRGKKSFIVCVRLNAVSADLNNVFMIFFGDILIN